MPKGCYSAEGVGASVELRGGCQLIRQSLSWSIEPGAAAPSSQAHVGAGICQLGRNTQVHKGSFKGKVCSHSMQAAQWQHLLQQRATRAAGAGRGCRDGRGGRVSEARGRQAPKYWIVPLRNGGAWLLVAL